MNGILTKRYSIVASVLEVRLRITKLLDVNLGLIVNV